MPIHKLNNPSTKYNFKPNKLLGQNFLRDKKVLHQIIKTAALAAGDSVLEIGPGLGALTEELSKRAGLVVAVEKDKKLAALLKERFKNTPNIKIIDGDILKILDSGIENFFKNLKLKIKNYKVVANIPYYLTSRLIRLLLESPNPPQDIILLVQKEVAQRICANPPQMSLLAVATQFYATAQICAKVSKNAFWPKPQVDSAIIRITPHSKTLIQSSPFEEEEKEGVNQKHFFCVVRAGFSQPRKQLINNLSRGLKLERQKIAKILSKIGLKPERRAETLSVEDWIKLTALIFSC
jgi:16S rRNA (adenine1518-N6/adenine1519-N6)-dimethyltransferase